MVHLTDVTLRDGLQVVSHHFSTFEKISLWNLLLPLGYSRYEITSFAHPKVMPQFSDSKEFCTAFFSQKPSVETMAFAPNLKGLERLVEFPIDWVSFFCSSTETFSQKNIQQSIDETLAMLETTIPVARKHRKKVRLYLSVVFGCPYEGEVKTLPKLLKRISTLDIDEIALSDTIGVGTPQQMEKILSQTFELFTPSKVALHLHNTYDLALASASKAFEMGVSKFDGTTGGIGGCPYAKGATGNVAIESLAYLFKRNGVSSFPKNLSSIFDFLKKNCDLSSPIAEILERGGTLYATP